MNTMETVRDEASVKSSLNLRVIQGIFWGISALQKDLRSFGYASFLRFDLPPKPLPRRQAGTAALPVI